MATENQRESWYDSRIGRVLYWGLVAATLVAVALSSTGAFGNDPEIPSGVYLFAFLGASVYAFTSFAKRFDERDRYRLKVLSRTIAALPLATGVYLLAFAFTGFDGGAGAADGAANGTQGLSGERVVAGLVFLAGLYVSTALQALGGIADRLLDTDGGFEGNGIPGRDGTPEGEETPDTNGDDRSEDASGAGGGDGDGDSADADDGQEAADGRGDDETNAG